MSKNDVKFPDRWEQRREWARVGWEFMTRNPEYQKDYEEVVKIRQQVKLSPDLKKKKKKSERCVPNTGLRLAVCLILTSPLYLVLKMENALNDTRISGYLALRLWYHNLAVMYSSRLTTFIRSIVPLYSCSHTGLSEHNTLFEHSGL